MIASRGAAITFAGLIAGAFFACGTNRVVGDTGSRPAVFGGPGPWGPDSRTYGAADGIVETPVVGMSTDETQNLWVATNAALYLLKPGEKTFHRFDAHDGLHLPGNAVTYCDADFAGGDRACPIQGAATGPGISEITGGGPNEVFVGYHGIDDGSEDWSDPNRHGGKLDRVRLSPKGTLTTDRFDLVSTTTAQFWHNRTVQRLLYDHFKHPHELYAGTNHGVDRFQPDKYRAPNKGEWFLLAANEFMSDHLHPQVCYHHACDATETDLRLGDWRGLALASDGNLWVGGRWTGGEIRWTPGLPDWLNRPGTEIFAAAFGDPYVAGRCDEKGFCNQPVFMVPQEGDVISVQAVAITPDGSAWFASGRTNTFDSPRGLAMWNGSGFKYYDPQRDLGMAEGDIKDMLALPDGRLALAGARTGITIWDPKTSVHTKLTGMPDDLIQRMELDRMVEPPTLHVATYNGAIAIRKLP